MIIPQAIKQTYSSLEPELRRVGDVVKQTIINFCERNSFGALFRYKSLESVAEKIETGRFSEWSELDDLFAATIVISVSKEEDEVILFLQEAFKEITIKRKGDTQKPPDAFRFDSTRFIGTLKEVPYETEESMNVKFEIQIKTAFEHAWAVTTHALTYKGTIIDWKRLRLAAQLKASVEQLDMLISGFDESCKHILKNTWPETNAKEKIATFFQKRGSDGIIPEEVLPKDWTRFCDNIYTLFTNCVVFNRRDTSQSVSAILDLVSEGIDLQKGTFPLSISLYQFVLGVLCDSKALKTDMRYYWPLVTPELEFIFSSTKGIVKNGFRLETKIEESVGQK